MSTKKYLSWLLVALMFLSVFSGGCGGGSSGGSIASSPNNTTQQKNNNNDAAPNTQNNSNGTQEVYSISEMTGTWVASNGSGTATGPDGTFSLSMNYCTAAFGNVDTSKTPNTVYVSDISASWDAYQNSVFVRTIPLNYHNQTAEIYNTGTNTWRYTFPSSESKITVTLTSKTTASVVEEGNFGLGSYVYQYKATYTMTKQ
ncbi:MAG: hypothetical protein SPL10_02740 [Synergistales bacterium]|nr:hypothetical protein [Synergistales bacterium]MDY6405103.1 hypothetical protein [Synergistales bacterium]MDY6410791.1 hypothetical protein [Synergistales bacterium]MDY6414058.1 hypothetical protein [Synergistales bacterium]MDY6423045.1 hypothetical protein [Synergistales bacterium]